MAFTTTDQHASGKSAMRVQAEKEDKILRTMQEICDYMRVSANTVRNYMKKYALPVRKVGGNWESSTAEIDAWKEREKA